MFGSSMLAAISVLATVLASQAPGARPAPVIPDECPRVLLTYRSGLGFEHRSGIVLAAWDSGVVLRAARLDRPDGAHLIGTAQPGAARSWIDAVKDSTFWRRPSVIAVDVGQYTLALRRDVDRLGRIETAAEPGEMPPPLAAIRQGAFDMALDRVVQVDGRIDEGRWQCPATIWRE